MLQQFFQFLEGVKASIFRVLAKRCFETFEGDPVLAATTTKPCVERCGSRV